MTFRYGYPLHKSKVHNERCPKCKRVVEGLLEEIYGDVESNRIFQVSTRVEGYRNFPCYQELGRIFLALQDYRGHRDFVRTLTLPPCDWFVPDPGFIVEFDESQHFTFSRKISLQNYPQDLGLGFSLTKWIELCEKTNARDNDPPFRDEQRAWYDTLRDFFPEIGGLEPTVRLYSKEMKWCSLDPENPEDVAVFKEIVESRKKGSSSWAATVVVQSNGKYSNEDRLRALAQIASLVTMETEGDGVILFPGGWFRVDQEARSLYDWAEGNVRDILRRTETNIMISLGIDGRDAQDQIGVAIGKKGIEAMGRKFHPAPEEEDYVALAENHLSEEENRSRIFELNGQRHFVAVCYDSFGIRQKGIRNSEGIDVVLDHVHGFYPKGEGGSGEVYFAKHGFAGASKQWGCLVFGAAVFFNRAIPERWPTGVYWNQESKSTQRWRYTDNPIKPKTEFRTIIEEGVASVRIYDFGKPIGDLTCGEEPSAQDGDHSPEE